MQSYYDGGLLRTLGGHATLLGRLGGTIRLSRRPCTLSVAAVSATLPNPAVSLFTTQTYTPNPSNKLTRPLSFESTRPSNILAVDAVRSCAHCHREFKPGAEHLALACGGGELTEAHAMHCSCAWAALSGAGEIHCGMPGCTARHAPSVCMLNASSCRRSAAPLATKVAGGPSAPASAAFAVEAAVFTSAAASAPGEQVLVTTHYVGADGHLAPGFSGVIRRGRSNRKLLGALGSFVHHFCLQRNAAASTPAEPPAFSLNDLRALALREASGTWRFVFALATGEAGPLVADELVPGSRQWSALGPTFLAWQLLLRIAGPVGKRTSGADYLTLVLNARKTSVNVKDLFSVLRLCNGRRTPLPMRAPTTDEAAFMTDIFLIPGAEPGSILVELFDNYGQRMMMGYDQWVVLMQAAISQKVQLAHGVGLTPEGAPQADDTPKDFAEIFPTPKAVVAALTPNDDDIVHVGKYVFTFLEDALALVTGGTLPELAAPGVKGIKKGYNEGDPKYQVELESTLALRAGYEGASDDRHLPSGERLMAPEDESGDPDEEYRDGPPDGLGGGPSVAAPAPAPATAPAPASAPSSSGRAR